MKQKNRLSGPFDSPPSEYEPQLLYDKMIQDRDVMVPMRDGVHLCVDVNRPEAPGKFPALLAVAPHNKDLQTPTLAEAVPPQPAWSTLWTGAIESGSSKYFVSRGYVHVIGNERGTGKSEDGNSSQWDYYDLIEWIAQQPWCDGNIGMVGISAFGGGTASGGSAAAPTSEGHISI